jgi:hypothetical protein
MGSCSRLRIDVRANIQAVSQSWVVVEMNRITLLEAWSRLVSLLHNLKIPCEVDRVHFHNLLPKIELRYGFIPQISHFMVKVSTENGLVLLVVTEERVVQSLFWGDSLRQTQLKHPCK